MSPMPLLLTLLMVAYIGSLWVSGRGGRSFGSPSGAEYLLLGVLLGPEALGVLGEQALHAFQPLAHVALGWMALGYGLECGMVGERRASLGNIVGGTLFAAFTSLVAGTCVFFAAVYLGMPAGHDLLLLSAAIGLVSAETTRHAVRWVIDRHVAEGPLADRVSELAAADDAFVLVAVAFLFAFASEPARLFGMALPPLSFAGVTLVLGATLGGACAWLLSRTPRQVEWWTLILGGAWFANGVAFDLGQSGMAAPFALGLTLSIASRHAPQLRAMFARTEGPVLLPALLLAGAHVLRPASTLELLLIGVALLGRTIAAVFTGTLVAVVRKSTRPAAGWLGFGMLSSGTLTMMVGFAIALRFPGQIGRVVLVVAGAGTLLGELIGPFALRRALARVGEIPQARDNAVVVSPPSGEATS
jgi:hypothetical protein